MENVTRSVMDDPWRVNPMDCSLIHCVSLSAADPLGGFNNGCSLGTKPRHRICASPLRVSFLIGTEILRQALWNAVVVSRLSLYAWPTCVTASAMSAMISAARYRECPSARSSMVQWPSASCASFRVSRPCGWRAAGRLRFCVAEVLRFGDLFLLIDQFSHGRFSSSMIRVSLGRCPPVYTSRISHDGTCRGTCHLEGRGRWEPVATDVESVRRWPALVNAGRRKTLFGT